MSLELVQTEALIDELRRRYRVVVLGLSTDLDGVCDVNGLSYKGPFLSVLGLVNVLHADVLEQYNKGGENATDQP